MNERKEEKEGRERGKEGGREGGRKEGKEQQQASTVTGHITSGTNFTFPPQKISKRIQFRKSWNGRIKSTYSETLCMHFSNTHVET